MDRDLLSTRSAEQSLYCMSRLRARSRYKFHEVTLLASLVIAGQTCSKQQLHQVGAAGLVFAGRPSASLLLAEKVSGRCGVHYAQASVS